MHEKQCDSLKGVVFAMPFLSFFELHCQNTTIIHCPEKDLAKKHCPLLSFDHFVHNTLIAIYTPLAFYFLPSDSNTNTTTQICLTTSHPPTTAPGTPALQTMLALLLSNNSMALKKSAVVGASLTLAQSTTATVKNTPPTPIPTPTPTLTMKTRPQAINAVVLSTTALPLQVTPPLPLDNPPTTLPLLPIMPLTNINPNTHLNINPLLSNAAVVPEVT